MNLITRRSLKLLTKMKAFQRTSMIFIQLFRLRRLQRYSKVFIVLLSACLISYFVFTFSKRPILSSNFGVEPVNSTGITRAMNVYIWRSLCGNNVTELKKSSFYPHYPDEKKLVESFEADLNDPDYGQLVFGYVHPQTTGLYRFAISSDDASELWLSASEDPKEKRMIAGVYTTEGLSAWTEKSDLNKYPGQISNFITLEAGGKYYTEAVHKQGSGTGFVQVVWQPPEKEFERITSEYISPYTYDTHVFAKKDVLHKLFSFTNQQRGRQELARKKKYLKFYSLPMVTEVEYLPSCPFNSSLILKDSIVKYNGIHVVYESNVFPEDDTDMGSKGVVWSWPNRVADKQIVHFVVDDLLKGLRFKTSRQYFLKKIHKVLQKSDPVYGDRFSVDLELGLKNDLQPYRLSEHVYLKKGSNSLCFPEGINWNSKATVYFILPIKEQGIWVYHFVNELTEASELTGDTNFHVIAVDFESQDINMTDAFNTPLLRSRHTIVNMTGKFYKTLALNEGVKRVPSPHDLLFLYDLHIDVPADILYSVRKNTIEGKIAYFPVVGRLECSSNPFEHKGFWQKDGYGILGVYKSDWIRFGGMNENDFKYDWGGEDWDLLDRVLNAHLEVERVKQPGLFHHFHSKRHSWNA